MSGVPMTIISQYENQITARTPGGIAGTTHPLMLTGSGTSGTPFGTFLYEPDPAPAGPVLTSVSPNPQPLSTFTVTTLIGTGLTGVIGIRIGEAATIWDFTLVSDTEITVTFWSAVPGPAEINFALDGEGSLDTGVFVTFE